MSISTIQRGVVSRDPEIHSGDPVFAGARVPVDTLVDYLEGGDTLVDYLEGGDTLVDYLEGGDTLDEFLDDFPTVSREQAIAALELMREALYASK